MLGQLMAQGAPQVAVMPFDLDKWRSRSSSADASHRFDELVEDARDQEAAESGVSLGELLEAAGTEAERLQLLRDFLVEQLAETLNTLPSTIETDASFRSLGLDSLTGLELRNRLETRSGLGLSATIVWNYPSVDRLAEFLDGKLREDEEPEAEAPPQEETDEPDLEALLEELESVSDEEAGRLLAESQRKGLVE